VFEYCDLEPEAPLHTDVRPPKDWPKRGSITFDRLQFSYHRTLPNVLHGITAKIHNNEKVSYLFCLLFYFDNSLMMFIDALLIVNGALKDKPGIIYTFWRGEIGVK